MTLQMLNEFSGVSSGKHVYSISIRCSDLGASNTWSSYGATGRVHDGRLLHALRYLFKTVLFELNICWRSLVKNPIWPDEQLKLVSCSHCSKSLEVTWKYKKESCKLHEHQLKEFFKYQKLYSFAEHFLSNWRQSISRVANLKNKHSAVEGTRAKRETLSTYSFLGPFQTNESMTVLVLI